jgi:tripartite-type tricarboxylate transporter receptor subunit TctC
MKKISALLATLMLAGAVLAQADYPSKPVKILVPFPAGGTSDVMARMLGDELTKALKQPFVVENKGGAGGTIGTLQGKSAPADGYTLVQTGVGQNAVAHGLDPKLAYNSLVDFYHLSQIHEGPNVLVVHPGTPFKTFKELIDYGRANPGKLSYGYTHAASGHMAMELLKQAVSSCPENKDKNGKVDLKKTCTPLFMVGIPYRGGGPMMTDILGGQIPLMFINQDTALQHVRSGKLRALAVSSLKRNSLYPDVPTVAELGYAGFNALSWSGMSVPKGTPKAITDKLESEIAKIMGSPAIKQRMESIGFVIPPQGSAAYTAFLKTELESWSKVIQKAGIKAE